MLSAEVDPEQLPAEDQTNLENAADPTPKYMPRIRTVMNF
jgi:hypothetical protein